jgi:hypothetical protein
MYLSMVLGLIYGVVADDYAPISANSFAIVGGASVLALIVAAVVPASGCRPSGWGRFGPWAYVALAGLAVILIASDAYRDVHQGSLVHQSLSLLPFLLTIGYSVRCRAWLAVCGAAGFVAVSVAMLVCNRSGGWAGFFSVYSA